VLDGTLRIDFRPARDLSVRRDVRRAQGVEHKPYADARSRCCDRAAGASEHRRAGGTAPPPRRLDLNALGSFLRTVGAVLALGAGGCASVDERRTALIDVWSTWPRPASRPGGRGFRAYFEATALRGSSASVRDHCAREGRPR